MSVPVWLIILSDQLTIPVLVGRYPTNKLMVRGLIFKQMLTSEEPFHQKPKGFLTLSGISHPFEWLFPI